MPEELRTDINAVPVDQVGVQTPPPVPVQPRITKPAVMVEPTLPRSVDYSQMSLDDLLREVDLLRKPSVLGTGNLVEPLPTSSNLKPDGQEEKLLLPTKEYVESDLPDLQPVILPESVNPQSENEPEIFVEDYIVLGDEIDQEMKEKIREAIMATRMASGGTGNPFVTRTVFKATSYCNKVLGRLNAPNHKRYRRDILLALINMHEKNQAWVDAAKSYERFLENLLR